MQYIRVHGFGIYKAINGIYVLDVSRVHMPVCLKRMYLMSSVHMFMCVCEKECTW